MWMAIQKYQNHFVIAFGVLLCVLFVVGVFSVKRAEAVVAYPFGGRILTVQPCAAPPGWVHITIQPAGLSPISLIWMPPPLTRTYLMFPFSPPQHPGQWVLGTIYGPGAAGCMIGFPPTFVPGFLMQMLGTSL